MKKYKSSGFQKGTGAHHPIVPNNSIIVWDEAQTATFPVQLAKGGSTQVTCTKQADGTFTGEYEEAGGYRETYIFSGFPKGSVHAERTDSVTGPVDTDTGTFTVTDIPTPIE